MSAKLLHYAELIVGGSPLCKRKAQAIALGFSLLEAWQTLRYRQRITATN